MCLSPIRLGLAGGILWGLAMFFITLLSLHTGYAEHFCKMMETLYLGYEVSTIGSLIGLVYGFVDAFVGLCIFAWLYNKLGCRCICDYDE